MKVIIAGHRDLDSMNAVEDAMCTAALSGIVPTEVVSGGAAGADTLGELWARHRGIPVKVFRARWEKYGRKAGPLRNQEMADYAQALVALPGPGSKGTHDMIQRARAKGLHVHVEQVSSLALARR